jgi:hypothetical protein
MAERELAQRDGPVRGQPGHAAQLAEFKAGAPGRRLAQLPAIEQARRRAALLFFQAQLGGFAVGQQKAAPVPNASASPAWQAWYRRASTGQSRQARVS